VAGFPTVRIDGSRVITGATSCENSAAAFRSALNDRLAETGGMSPVEITGEQYADDGQLHVSTTFRLVDPVTLGNLRATILIYQDNVLYQGQTWNHVTRKIIDAAITLALPGDQASLDPMITLKPGWRLADLHVVAYLQQTDGNKQVIQASPVPHPKDFEIAFTPSVRSVPGGNGTAYYDGWLTNLGSAPDTLTLDIAVPLGDWSTDFTIGGDPTPHTMPTGVVLAPADTCLVRIRVRTSSEREIRWGSFRAHSARSGRPQSRPIILFNKNFSILVVDNDGDSPAEQPIVTALDTLDRSYIEYDVPDLWSYPKPEDMAGYDIVIHETSRLTLGVLNDAATEALSAYLDRGGALFLTSQHYLNTVPPGGNSFTRDCLGIASFTLDKGYTTMTGIPGDEIGNGMTLPLHFLYPSYRRGDDAVPGPTASCDFLANDDPPSHALIRNVGAGGAKVVFMPEAFDAVSDSDPDPNNTRVLLHRILEWLAPSQAGVPTIDVATAWHPLEVRPNPSHGPIEIAFTLSRAAAAGPVRLAIFDVSGREIATLVDGRLPPGPHLVPWDGRSGSGERLADGIYFTRLTTSEGPAGRKVVCLQ
jgi:hypothetical protein